MDNSEALQLLKEMDSIRSRAGMPKMDEASRRDFLKMMGAGAAAACGVGGCATTPKPPSAVELESERVRAEKNAEFQKRVDGWSRETKEREEKERAEQRGIKKAKDDKEAGIPEREYVLSHREQVGDRLYNAVNDNRVYVGMPEKYIRAAAGKPDDVIINTYSHSTHTTLVYRRRKTTFYIFVIDGKLSSYSQHN